MKLLAALELAGACFFWLLADGAPERKFRWMNRITTFNLVMLFGLHVVYGATINPPPPGEGSTLAIVEAHCPNCEAAPFAADGYWVIAFEEDYAQAHVRDFNGLIVEAEFAAGSLLSWRAIYSTLPMQFGFDGTDAFATSAWPTTYTTDSRNYWGHKQALTWTLPADVTEAPEPGTLGLLLAGVSVASVSRYRRKFAAPRKRGRPEANGERYA